MNTENELDTYRPPNPAAAVATMIGGLLLLIVIGATLIANWKAFVAYSDWLIKGLITLALLAFGFVAVALVARGLAEGYRVWLRIQHEQEDLKARREDLRRKNERHELDLELSRGRLHADERGNRPAIYNPSTGQVIIVPSGNYMQPVPSHYAPHVVYDYKDTSTKVSEEKPAAQGLLGAGIQQPSQDWMLDQLPENALVVSPGVQASDGKIVKVSICDVPHFKILGSTGFGKSCLAGSILDQATQLNSREVFQLACLDLEHKTSRLFEDLPHITTCRVGNRLVQMVATNADEVVEHLGYLKKVLDYRAGLSEQELTRLPVLFMYVEEMLSLQYEVVDPKQLKAMLADLTILSVRGRKYGMFLLACMQTDYSTDEMRVSQKMFRFRAAAAIDQTAARAAGFQNTELIKQNFQTGQPGQFVIEYPSFSQVVLAPIYDVKRLVTAKTRSRDDFMPFSDREKIPGLTLLKSSRNIVETTLKTDETTLHARLQEVRHFHAMGWGKVAIIEKVWKVKAGGTAAYKNACTEYDQMVAQIEREA